MQLSPTTIRLLVLMMQMKRKNKQCDYSTIREAERDLTVHKKTVLLMMTKVLNQKEI